jgi:hypothetical protein
VQQPRAGGGRSLVTSVSAGQVFRHPPHPDPAEQQAAVARQRAIRKDPDQFGPLCCQILQIPAPAFTTIDPPVTGTMVSGTLEGYRFIDPGSGSAEVWAPLTLPSGVLVDFLDLYYKDTEPDNEICVDLVGMTGTTAPLVDVLATSCSTGSAGFGYASHLVAIQIDNDVAHERRAVRSRCLHAVSPRPSSSSRPSMSGGTARSAPLPPRRRSTTCR